MHMINKIILLLYINDYILFCKNNKKSTKMIKIIQKLFNLTEQNIRIDIVEYLEYN